ncbi:MAG: N-acetyltransferase [Thermodesulfobacteriota bacterium]|nr:N-acetyltransferase [Thermodesulfobacteriota bacterium]
MNDPVNNMNPGAISGGVIIKKADVHMVQTIKDLIDPFVQDRVILPKSLYALYTSIRDFRVACQENKASIIGCCALQVSWQDLGEIRTLAVDNAYQGRGFGRKMVEHCIYEAVDLGLDRLFTLTYVPDFFRDMGFFEVDKSTLPNKIWADCIHCPYFPDCREIAMVYEMGTQKHG